MAHIIFGMQLSDRESLAHDMQKLLTEYGCSIKTRFGLHDVHGNVCSPTGIILLEMFGDEAPINELEEKLKGMDGVTFKKMVFD